MKNSILCAVLLLGSAFTSIGTQVSPATGGNNISVDTAADAPLAAWTSLGHIEIYENGHSRGDISSGTLILKVPDGFEFNTNQTPSISFNQGKDIRSATLVLADSQTLVITVEADEALEPDKIYIGQTVSIQVRPTTSTTLAQGHIYVPTVDGGSMVLPGIIRSLDGTTGTSFGDLVETIPPSPFTLTVLDGADAAMLLRVIGSTNTIYTLQYCDDLGSTNWTALGQSSLAESGFQELDGVIPEPSARFYRAVLAP